MAHTVALEVGLPTTRELEPMLAGALSMGHTDPAGLRKLGIHAREPMRKLVRDPMFTEWGFLLSPVPRRVGTDRHLTNQAT